MKKMKKVLAVLLAMAMVLGMSMTTFAAEGETNPYQEAIKDDTASETVEGYPSAADTGTVKISGIIGVTENNVTTYPTVALYQIARPDYKDNGLKGYVFIEGTQALDTTAPKSSDIASVAQKILLEDGKPGKITAENKAPSPQVINNGVFTATIGAGAYIAIISGSPDGSVYNPIYLTVTYNEKGEVVSGNVSVNEHYLWGSTAVVKHTEPNIQKDIIDGTTTDEEIPNNGKTEGEGQQTASLGKDITYQIKPVPMPSYPADATNKTLFIADTMKAGLTFKYDTLQLQLMDAEGNFVQNAENKTLSLPLENNQFTYNNKVLGTAAPTMQGVPLTDSETVPNGFNINFDYDELIYDVVTGAAYTPVIVYNATINESAVIGTIDENGNTTNEVELYYANNPVSGSTHEGTTKPDVQEGGDISVKRDEEVVYTYRLAFKKVTDSTTNPTALAGAIFGIYTEEACTTKVGEMVSNESGFAISDQIEKGDYWVKEIQAPAGYALNDTAYKISASYKTATYKITTTTESSYKWSTDTAKAENPDNPEQIGWAKNGKLYPMSTYANADVASADHAEPAYKVAANGDGAVVTKTVVEANNIDGTGVSGGVDTDNLPTIQEIPNTQLTALPSTGGIGTTIFTVGGCAIMIIAAGLYFATKKKAAR